MGRNQGQHSKRESQDGCLASPDNRVHKDRKPLRSTSRTEGSPDSDGSNGGVSKSPRLHKVKGEEIRRRRQSSSSQNVEREKSDDREADWKKGRRECDVRVEDSSARKRKTSEWKSCEEETEGVMESKLRMKSTLMADNRALSPFNETFLERELKRIREHSHKDPEKHETSSHYSDSKTGSHYSETRTVGDKRSAELTRNRGDEVHVEERSNSKQFKGQSSATVFHDTNSKAAHWDAGRLRESPTSLRLRDKVSGSVKDKGLFLVSYEDSSDDGNG